MGWKRGPMPAGTYYWGGIVLVKNLHEGKTPHGFNFANFDGDHALILGKDGWIRVEPDEVAYYNNDLKLPVKDFLEEDC